MIEQLMIFNVTAPAPEYYDVAPEYHEPVRAPIVDPVPAVPYDAHHAAPAPAVVKEYVAAPAPAPAPVVETHHDSVNALGNRQVGRTRTYHAPDHTAHHADHTETGPGHIVNTHVDHTDHGFAQVTDTEHSIHDLLRDKESHKVTHEEVHANPNGGPPLVKRISHGYKRPAPHVKTLYNRRVEAPVAHKVSYPVHPGIAHGSHAIYNKY